MEEAPCRRRLGQRMCRAGGGGLGLFKAAAVNEQLEEQYITQYKDEEELGGGGGGGGGERNGQSVIATFEIKLQWRCTECVCVVRWCKRLGSRVWVRSVCAW